MTSVNLGFARTGRQRWLANDAVFSLFVNVVLHKLLAGLLLVWLDKAPWPRHIGLEVDRPQIFHFLAHAHVMTLHAMANLMSQ
jgi:hypothetical protein